MSQPAKMPEPTMEEILASIRRIIAEDDLRPPPPPPADPASANPAPANPAPANPAPANPAPPERVAMPAAAQVAPREDFVEGFDDPQVSNVAANDTFEQRESPWRPGELADIDGTAEEAHEPAAPDIDHDPPNPFAALEALRFAKPDPAPPEPVRDQPSREAAPRLEPFRSGAAMAELAKLELARSEFARAETTKSEVARPDRAQPDPAKPQMPRFELPRRDTARWESPRPEAQESIRPEPPRPEPMRPEPMRSEPARAPAAPPPPALRAFDDGLLSPHTTAAVDLAFNTLAQTVLVQNSRTLEDLVREMLKPMLKAWLDDNLPGLVERLIRAEIERVSRGRS
jgi:cell pole-organizing protein PopZ